jgi:hypothetical protein
MSIELCRLFLLIIVVDHMNVQSDGRAYNTCVCCVQIPLESYILHVCCGVGCVLGKIPRCTGGGVCGISVYSICALI